MNVDGDEPTRREAVDIARSVDLFESEATVDVTVDGISGYY